MESPHMNPLPAFPEELMTVDDVARVFRASKSWIYKAVERGDLPCVRLGALVRFDPAVVRRFIESRSVPAAATT